MQRRMKKIKQNAVSRLQSNVLTTFIIICMIPSQFEELAHKYVKNVTYLCGLFKKEMNTTIGSYIVSKG